jgi:hypothetical protein
MPRTKYEPNAHSPVGTGKFFNTHDLAHAHGKPHGRILDWLKNGLRFRPEGDERLLTEDLVCEWIEEGAIRWQEHQEAKRNGTASSNGPESDSSD